jgi:8-oxo-dGTP diphosphatase
MTRFWPLAALFSALAGLWGLFRLLTSGGHVHGILPRLWGLSFYLPISYSLRLTVLRFIGYSFMVGTGAVIRSQDGKYLLARHTYPIGESRHEVWGIPGGTVDRYENIKETIRREVSQELGLAISVGKLLLVDVSLAPRLDVFFECHVLDGEFRPSSEIAEIGYFDLEAPPDGIAGRHLRLMKAFSAGCEETQFS